MKRRGDGDGVGRAVPDNAEAVSVRRGRPGRRRRELGGSCSRSTLGPTMQGLRGRRPPVSICAHCPHSLRSVPARTINYEATLFMGHITEFVPRSTSVQEGLVIAPTSRPAALHVGGEGLPAHAAAAVI